MSSTVRPLLSRGFISVLILVILIFSQVRCEQSIVPTSTQPVLSHYYVISHGYDLHFSFHSQSRFRKLDLFPYSGPFLDIITDKTAILSLQNHISNVLFRSLSTLSFCTLYEESKRLSNLAPIPARLFVKCEYLLTNPSNVVFTQDVTIGTSRHS